MSNATDIGTRYMTIKLILDTELFPSGNNTKIIRCNSDQNSSTAEVTITKSTGFSDASAYVTIYGLPINDINAFSRYNLSTANELPQNWVEIYAGYTIDSTGLPPLAYRGQIRYAGPNLNNRNRALLIISQWGFASQNTPSPTTAPQGDITLDQLFGNMANLFNPPLSYQGNSVNGEASNPNYSGSALDQVNQLGVDYGYKVKQDNGKLLVAPVGQPFNSTVYELTSKNGMIGYPIPEEFGITVRCRYNPVIQFGQAIKVVSAAQFNYNDVTTNLLVANSQWYINGMMSILQNRGQKWETVLKLNNYQFNIQGT